MDRNANKVVYLHCEKLPKQNEMKKYIYFSATGTTERVMEALGGDTANQVNVTAGIPSADNLKFTTDDLIFLGFPVFGGRVPAIYLERIAELSGGGCKAVVVAVYGNRHYDDAAREMQDFATAHGCEVVAAITAVAQHSIATTIAAGRPDDEDLKRLNEFAVDIDRRFAAGELPAMPHTSEQPYKEYRQLPVLPQSSEDCSLCGICADECPTAAITIDNELITDPASCILCMRCVAVCPSEARALPADVLAKVTAMIQSRCNGRRETEISFG